MKQADVVQQLSQDFMIVHGKSQILIAEGDDGEVEDVAANKVDEDVHHIRTRYNSWLSKHQQSSYPPKSNKTKSSRSSSKSSYRSSRSRSSKGISEKLAVERAKLVEIKVAREFEK